MLLRNMPDILKANKKIAVAAIILAVVFVLGYGIKNPEIGARIHRVIKMQDDSASIRLKLWQNTMHIIKDNPMLGTGAGNFPVVYSYYQSKSLDPEMYKKAEFFQSAHAHNDYLQIAAEYGIPGAGAFLLILFVVMRIKTGGDIRGYAVKAGFGGLLLHAVFNFPFLIIPTISMFFALAAYLASGGGNGSFISKRRRLPAPVIYTGVFTAVLAAALSTHIIIGDSYLRKARESMYFKTPQTALEYMKRATDIKPGDYEYYITKAGIFSELGQGRNAHNSYRRALELNSGSWIAAGEVFRYDLAADEYDEAEKNAKKLYGMSPYSKGAITSYGYALYLNGKYEEAVKIYKKGMGYFSEDYDMLYHLSAVYGAMGETQKAKEFAENAVRVNPEDPGAYYNLAVAVFKEGDIHGAEGVIKDALEKFPDEKRLLGLKEAVKNASKE